MNSVKTTTIATSVLKAPVHGSGKCRDVGAVAGTYAGAGVVVMDVTYSRGYRAGARIQLAKVFNTSDSTHMFIGVEGK
jgi:hypothetical protein